MNSRGVVPQLPTHFYRGGIITGDNLELLRDSAVAIHDLSMPHEAEVLIFVARRVFVVKEDLGDVLRCHSWDRTGESNEDVFVAKPYSLRQTPFDGASVDSSLIFSGDGGVVRYAYTLPGLRYATAVNATDATETAEEYQAIVPEYAVDSRIIASRGIAGGLDLEYGGSGVFWADDNVDGRQWLEVPREG